MIFFSLLPRQNLSDKAKYLDPNASGVADYDYRADLYGRKLIHPETNATPAIGTPYTANHRGATTYHTSGNKDGNRTLRADCRQSAVSAYVLFPSMFPS